MFPKSQRTEALPSRPESYAVMGGPVVLAGIVNEERTIVGDPKKPDSFLSPENEREWWRWQNGYRTARQSRPMRMLPLFEVENEPYTVYFPIVQSTRSAE